MYSIFCALLDTIAHGFNVVLQEQGTDCAKSEYCLA